MCAWVCVVCGCMICTHHESINCPGTLLAALSRFQPAELGALLFWPSRERLSNTSTLCIFSSHLYQQIWSAFIISCFLAWIPFYFTVSYLTRTHFSLALYCHHMFQSFDPMRFSNFSFPVLYLAPYCAHLSSPSLRLCTVTCPFFVSIPFNRLLCVFIMMCVVLQALLVPWCFFASRVSGPD